MLTASARNHRIASNLLFAGIVLFHLPNAVWGVLAFWPLMRSGAGGLAFLPLGIHLLSLGLLTKLAFGIRAGKPWAKGLFVLYFAWNIFGLLKRGVAGAPTDAFAVGMAVALVALLLGVAFFLFRDTFRRQPRAGADLRN